MYIQVRQEVERHNMNKTKVDVIILVYHPGKEFEKIIDRLEKQIYKVDHIILLHTRDGQSLENLKQKYNNIVIVEIEPEDIPLDIVYEDEDIIIVNKPKGMVVHPAPGHYSGTLVNGLMYHFKDSLSGINGELRPGIVHRIDMDTTGLLVVCKNDAAHNFLSEQLAVHSITRKYYAICFNYFTEDEGIVDLPIGRHPTDRKKMAVNYKNGRNAVTHYKVLKKLKNNFCLIECQLETGRTHQIRVHMAYIKHPLLGDAIYGPKNQPYHLQGHTLHAGVHGFIHTSTKEYEKFYKRFFCRNC